MITLLAWIILGAQMSTASKPARVPLSINISTSTSAVPYGTFIVFKIKFVNRTDHPINCTSEGLNGVNTTYAFEITNSAGKKVLPKIGQMAEYGYSRCVLDPKTTKSWEQSIQPSSYPQLVPGEYHIRVATQNPDDPHGEKLFSNTVDIEIEPHSAYPVK